MGSEEKKILAKATRYGCMSVQPRKAVLISDQIRSKISETNLIAKHYQRLHTFS
jgi:hypothetical protein